MGPTALTFAVDPYDLFIIKRLILPVISYARLSNVQIVKMIVDLLIITPF